MLMCCRMIDNLRMICLKYIVQPVGIAHRANQRLHPYIRILTLQLLLYIVCIILVNIKNDKKLRVLSGYLTAKLTTYGATATCNHNHLAL